MAAYHLRVKITSQHCLSLLVCQDWLSRKKYVLLTTFIYFYFLEVGLLGIAFQALFTILISCSQNGFTLMKCFFFFFCMLWLLCTGTVQEVAREKVVVA